MLLPKITAVDLSQAAEQLRDVPAAWIDSVNWPAQFPEAPRTMFRAGHNGRMLFLRFQVDEAVTMAQVGEDNGAVWTDSAVEFFIRFDQRGYYNFEFTCTGRALLGFREIQTGLKSEARHGDRATMRSILREASLGSDLFAERHVEGGWSLSVGIPLGAFFAHELRSFDGLRAWGNFYKCGDGLSRPHFLSWAPICTPDPNFHVPEFFGSLVFGG